MEQEKATESSVTHISCLYREILTTIFSYLNTEDKARAAQVCVAWKEAAYCKSLWRGVEAEVRLHSSDSFKSLVQRGIRRVKVLSLTVSPADIVRSIPNIESLRFRNLNLTDRSINELFYINVYSLTVLDLSGCRQITDTSLMKISERAVNISDLYLSGCIHITNIGLLFLSHGLRKLKILDLENCAMLADEGLKILSACFRNLEKLNVNFCRRITDSGLEHLANMHSLRELRLRDCRYVSDVGLSYLAKKNSQMVVLDVSFCNVTDQGLLHISQGIVNLRNLYLIACDITDEGLSNIARSLRDLRILSIGQSYCVTDRSVSLIADHLQRLETIYLIDCQYVTKQGVQFLSNLPNVIICDFAADVI